jgi:hypothetical protein
MIPDVSAGEDYVEALARVRRCINGGGQETAEDDDDSDLEVVAESITVNLRCPVRHHLICACVVIRDIIEFNSFSQRLLVFAKACFLYFNFAPLLVHFWLKYFSNYYLHGG